MQRGTDSATHDTGAAEEHSQTQLLQAIETHLRRKETDLAEERLRSFLGDHPDNADALALFGVVLLRRYELDAARSSLERAVELAPTSAFVRLRMAEYWLALGIPARAQEELNVALIASADNAASYNYVRSVAADVRQSHRGGFERNTPPLPGGGIASAIKRSLRLIADRANKRSQSG